MYLGERGRTTVLQHRGGRPKITWKRTVERERNKAGWKSWNVAKTAVQERECWSEDVSALCTYWHGETW